MIGFFFFSGPSEMVWKAVTHYDKRFAKSKC
jgi:hypothetical protein